MRISRTGSCSASSPLRTFLGSFLLGVTVLFFASCAKTVSVYHPPHFDLARFGRIWIITFSDNAQPSVAQYATERFQNHIHSAQTGIPIVELGTEEQVLKSIGSSQLDLEAIESIGQRYGVSAVFSGSIVYSDVQTNVNLKDISEFKASVNATLNATLSVKLIETEGGATVWSSSASWKRNLGKISVDQSTGISLGTKGYDDAHRKLIPDMVQDVTSDFRGRYVKQRVNE